ncbi:MAG: efflux RND transporter periplasmic adaptor subunit, partial [Vulcanimicrobiaceae bacterium]
SAPPIPTVAARAMTLRPTLTLAGIIAPLQNVAITSSLSEPADKVLVNEGDHVRKGQVLAVLDTADLRAQLAQDQTAAASADAKVTQTAYQAQLAINQSPDQVTQARAALAQAQATQAQDQANLARDRQLLAGGYIASQTAEQQQTTVNNDAAAIRSAQAALASANENQRVNGTESEGLQAANLAAARSDAASAHAAAAAVQVQIGKATIVSPVDGVVTNRNLNPGEYPSGRTLFTIQAIASVYAELNASSANVFALRKGAPVTLAVSGAGGRPYLGQVVAVLGQVQPGSTNFTVKVLVARADGALQAGVPVTATIALPVARGIGIPTTAFLDDTHGSLIEDHGGVAKTVAVHELASDGTHSIVSGLRAGTVVVSNGQLGVVDGQRIASSS